MAFYIRRKLPGAEKPDNVHTHPSNRPVVVTFGSSDTSDIQVDVTDPNERVRPRHCTLVYTGAGFRIDFERDTRVFIGESTTPAYGLTDPFHESGDDRVVKLRLGMPVSGAVGPGAVASRNPVFYLERDETAGGDAASAEPARKRPQVSYDPIEQIKRTARDIVRQRWMNVGFLLGGSLLAAAIVWLGWTGYRRYQWTSEIEAAYFPSVGVVGVVDLDADGNETAFEPTGTGWLCCDSESGDTSGETIYVVTNGHVWSASGDVVSKKNADAVKTADGGQAPLAAKIVVRFPDKPGAEPGAGRQVAFAADVASAKHRLYAEFGGYLRDEQLRDRAPNVYDAIALPITDVSSLAVLDGRRRFALAPKEQVPRAGETVAIIGYPIENILYPVNADSPVPKFYTPEIVRRTNPFQGPESALVPSVIAAKAEAAGGLSGSPIIGEQNGRMQVVGIVMQANLIVIDPPAQPPQSGPQAGSDSQADGTVAADEGLRRLATSDVVFATDAEVVRELFSKTQRLSEQESKGAWASSRNSRFRDPLNLDFTRFTGAHPKCRSLRISVPKDAPTLYLGSHEWREPIGADEVVWVAARGAEKRNAPLELAVKRTGAADPSDGDFFRVPGFAGVVTKSSPKAGELAIILKGDLGETVRIYIERCATGEVGSGARENGRN